MSEYTEKAEAFLKAHELEFRAVHVGSDCPTFCEDAAKHLDMDKIDKFPRNSHIHGHHYHVTISRKGRGHFTIDFWNSYADEFHNWAIKNRLLAMDSITTDYRLGEKVKAELRKSKNRFEPTAYDVFACITKDDPGTFIDFCGNFGYDEDSRKAGAVYFAVQKEWSKARQFFTPEELAELQEIN